LHGLQLHAIVTPSSLTRLCLLNLQSYGTAGREAGTACTLCSTQNTGFSFEWNMNNDIWQAAAVSKLNANQSGDCLSEFQQVMAL
jgi:hypothetical protein